MNSIEIYRYEFGYDVGFANRGRAFQKQDLSQPHSHQARHTIWDFNANIAIDLCRHRSMVCILIISISQMERLKIFFRKNKNKLCIWKNIIF